MKKLIVVVIAMAIIAMTGVAMAADNATVNVTANVVGTCKFLTGGTMAFGALDPSAGTDTNATVTQPTFWCTKNASYTIGDDGGANKSGSQHGVKHATLTEYINYSMSFSSFWHVMHMGHAQCQQQTLTLAAMKFL